MNGLSSPLDLAFISGRLVDGSDIFNDAAVIFVGVVVVDFFKVGRIWNTR